MGEHPTPADTLSKCETKSKIPHCLICWEPQCFKMTLCYLVEVMQALSCIIVKSGQKMVLPRLSVFIAALGHMQI